MSLEDHTLHERDARQPSITVTVPPFKRFSTLIGFGGFHKMIISQYVSFGKK